MEFNKVKVIGVTKPVVDFIPTSEDVVSYAARVSNPSNQDNFETSAGLLKYCVKHKHFSVFETVNVLIEIKTPRDIARQILRHRSFSFQEFSQRYAIAPGFTLREARLQDEKNRQNSIETEDLELIENWNLKQQEIIDLVTKSYEWAIANGIAKECARVILPEGNTMSHMYMNGTLRSWIHYAKLRGENGTQLEHSDIAVLVKQELFYLFPFLEEVWDFI